MARTLFIVQGEGRGHLSQSVALKEHLEEAGHSIEAVYVGGHPSRKIPDYYQDLFGGKLRPFSSPWFLRTPNKKGIYVGRTIGYNLINSAAYFRSIAMIRKEIDAIQPDVIFNFYELLGALAMKKTASGIRKIGLGHHFYLHLKSSLCRQRPVWHRALLRMHTQMIIKSCNRVLALSYRKEDGSDSIRVVPPLVRREFRDMSYVAGDRYLVYLLQEGFFYDLVQLARNMPGFRVDLFTSLKPDMEIPEGFRLHPFDAKNFSNLMASCRGLISTAGFDTAAEAACQGIPLAVIPTQNHLEQKCNGADIQASGIGICVSKIDQGILEQMDAKDCSEYRAWVNLAGEMIIKYMKE